MAVPHKTKHFVGKESQDHICISPACRSATFHSVFFGGNIEVYWLETFLARSLTLAAGLKYEIAPCTQLLNRTELKRLCIISGSSSAVESKRQSGTVTAVGESPFLALCVTSGCGGCVSWRATRRGRGDCPWHKTERQKSEKGHKLQVRSRDIILIV